MTAKIGRPCSISAIQTQNSPVLQMKSFVPSSGSTSQKRSKFTSSSKLSKLSSEQIGILLWLSVDKIASFALKSAEVSGELSSLYEIS